ncbi:MAG: SUMF1/EgtB/PvdO family nonheme iron enzyme [Pseudomonadota bacterium]|nr:SUMF1/EgtB/PvdO family nonheme iron enzyme [Pseudomonadota bacterium]
MSDDRSVAELRLGFLLLRDGHAVPLEGISPEEIKAGARHLVPHPDAEPLKHNRMLTAVVDRLGFRGDFGNYKNQGWPSFEAFLRKHGCSRHAGLFPSDHGGCIDLAFRPVWGPTRRQLADRIFESGAQPPKCVFLGYGVDWATWDGGSGHAPPKAAIPLIGGDPGTALPRAERLWAGRLDLPGQWGFVDDKLVAGPVRHVVDKSYWPPGSSEQERKANFEKVRAAVLAFRAVFDAGPEGWVEVLRYNDRLVVLRAADGSWDVLWRAYRAEEPPKPADVSRSSDLAVEDLPLMLMGESDHRRALHFRQEVWEEHEAHAAEQAFYDRGGSIQERQLTRESDVRLAWLRQVGRLPAAERLPWSGDVPPGFHVVEVGARRLAVGELVHVGDFRRMLVETGYLDRRADGAEPWERANEGAAAGYPVGATWADAQAFCAWMERKLGIAVRLPSKAELRAMRPFYSERYAKMAALDFPWENYPPRPIVETGPGGEERRRDLPSAVDWAEPRFLAPAPDLAEFPSPSGWSSQSRKCWIVDFPPAAAWVTDLPWEQHAGLRFIDAWDAYEWCQESGEISGRFWEGPIGPTSWGAYKNVKVSFRLVLELGE